MDQARGHASIKDPNAMVIATASLDGQPHARVVLCKEWGDEGFVFYTNYASRKGRELEAVPKASGLFYWDPLFRQVKIDGVVRQTSRARSEAYWNSRARGSQLSQYISAQSAPLDARATLEAAWARAEDDFKDRPIPCPPHWGGYVLEPRTIEFWIGRDNRLHDRHEFTKSPGGWTHRMLYP